MKRLTKKERARVLLAMSFVDKSAFDSNVDISAKFCCNALRSSPFHVSDALVEQFRHFFGYPTDDASIGWFGDVYETKNQNTRLTALALFLAADGVL